MRKNSKAPEVGELVLIEYIVIKNNRSLVLLIILKTQAGRFLLAPNINLQLYKEANQLEDIFRKKK